MAEWYANGVQVERVPISDRGFQYGDGLFETVAIRRNEPRLWPFHLERLMHGCDVLGYCAPSDADLSAGIRHALEHSHVSTAYCVVKIVVSAGVGTRGYGRARDVTPSVIFGAFPSVPVALSAYRKGVRTVMCRTQLATNSTTAGLKTLNRLEQVLARSEIVTSDAYEGLTKDADGNIICGTMSNVFFVRGASISTPPLDCCGVAGVMRRHVMAVLALQGSPVAEQTIDANGLEHVDEVFIANSQFGILPVASCDDRVWGVGERTRTIMTTMAGNGIDECRS